MQALSTSNTLFPSSMVERIKPKLHSNRDQLAFPLMPLDAVDVAASAAGLTS